MEVILFPFDFLSQNFQMSLDNQINADLRQQTKDSSSYSLLTTDLYTWLDYRISQHIFYRHTFVHKQSLVWSKLGFNYFQNILLKLQIL